MKKPIAGMRVPVAGKEAGAILRACLSPSSFWWPEQVGPQISWLEHAPFAFWLVEALRPKLIVELGTHGGFSYFALCQAVRSLHLDSRCYAVDTWEGDEHAGFYGEDVFHAVSELNQQRYGAFSTLIRSTFNTAASHFEDASIDLLHVDGRHRYEDAKHDFSTWQPKLSSRAVVLFHDTNVREKDFGITRLWGELRGLYPNFEFLHGHGLGVLGVGDRLRPQVSAFFSLANTPEGIAQARTVYSRLGVAVSLRFKIDQLQPIVDQQKQELAQWAVNAEELHKDIALRTAEEGRIREEVAKELREIARMRAALEGSAMQIAQLEQQIQQSRNDLTRTSTEQRKRGEVHDMLQRAIAQRDATLTGLEQELDGLRRALGERDTRIRELDHELAIRGTELASLREAAGEREATIDRLGQELATRTIEADSLRQAISERNASVEDLGQQLNGRTVELDTLRRALSKREENVSEFRQQVAARTMEGDALRQTISEHELRSTDLTRRLLKQAHYVSALRSSSSWRITAPLRLAKRMLHAKRLLRHWACMRAIARSELFDRAWYLRNNPDVEESGVDPIAHYVLQGAMEGRDPSASFSTRAYLVEHPDVAGAGVNPLEHFIKQSAAGILAKDSNSPSSPHPEGKTAALPVLEQRQNPLEEESGVRVACFSREGLAAAYRALKESELFDLDWYRAAAGINAAVDPIEHYLQKGWRAGLEPNAVFEGRFFYPYFRSAGYQAPPALTYLQLRAAGAPVYATAADAERWASVIRSTELFEPAAYAARVGLPGGLDPLLHYVMIGEHLGQPPSNGFDPLYYRERYPDIAGASVSCLGHYITFGRAEGRRPISVAAGLVFHESGVDETRETVLIISHEASRTGAPIVAYNIAKRLHERYNIVTALLGGGELIPDFKELSADVIGPISQADWHPVEFKHIVHRLTGCYSIAYAIANSTESRFFIPALATSFIPVISLIHEFASYTRPKGALGNGLDWSTQIVFSTDIIAASAQSEHPRLANRTIHILPQGRCEVPKNGIERPRGNGEDLRGLMRPKGYENALIVLGVGFVHIRKGVDIFLSCASAVKALDPKRPVRFIWIGDGYDIVNDHAFSTYLAEQIARSGLDKTIAILDSVEDLGPAYETSGVFFLSSRLDPLPNVAIEAAFRGLPIVCFEHASGMAALLASDPALRSCVVPYLDVSHAARVIAKFANDENSRRNIGAAARRFAEVSFDVGRYVDRLDALGREAMEIMRQRELDFFTLRDDPLFDEKMFLAAGSTTSSRNDAIREFLCRWAAVRTSGGAGGDFNFRRPCAGFHPQIYALENRDQYDSAVVNPLAQFIRHGKPDGPWRHHVITPDSHLDREPLDLRVGLHAHFFYPELIRDFVSKLDCNRSGCDLLLTTDTSEKADLLRDAVRGYRRGEAHIRLVPNRGRDIGALLTGFHDVLSRYGIIGHIHGKRSLFALNSADPNLGERRREFLWQNLVGGRGPMMDVILGSFAGDQSLGLVFAEDVHLSDWDDNLAIAEEIAQRMGLKGQLPPFFDFPSGTMFWARSEALIPLTDLCLGWDDYPQEPVPADGTILHALERLLPFVASHAGYQFATTRVPGVTW